MGSEVWREQGRGFVRMLEKTAGYRRVKPACRLVNRVACQSDRKTGPIASMRTFV